MRTVNQSCLEILYDSNDNMMFCSGRTIYNCLSKIAETLEANEEHLNDLDRLAGDGDCGSTLKRAAQGKHATDVG